VLRRLIRYIEGGRKAIVRELEKEMRLAAKLHDFENAARLRNNIYNVRSLQQKIMFGDKEFLDISKDKALSDLVDLLGLPKAPARIEGYDVSHMGGTNVVASMVVFRNGVSDRAEYRKFKTRLEHNDDFYNMNETVGRRFSEKNVKAWGMPELVVIDGGKGQLDAALKARDERGITVPFIGLAKREEQIVIDFARSGVHLSEEVVRTLDGYVTKTENFLLVNLPHASHIVKLLQRIRDESHRFAISYHTVLKRAGQTKSGLDDIPGVGPVTKRTLIRKFGSLRALKDTPEAELAAVVGVAKAKKIYPYLQAE
jgi:excinuclease ABC subunit C